jgi:hypothetical protein
MMINKRDNPPKTAHKAVGGVRLLCQGAEGAAAGGGDRLATRSLSITFSREAAPSGGGVAFSVSPGIAMEWPQAGQFNALPRRLSGIMTRFLQWLQTTRMAMTHSGGTVRLR